jgi:SAM-dependent methyltransferase
MGKNTAMSESLLKLAKWLRNRIFKPYTLNNAAYWNNYALLWKLSSKNRIYEYLGGEWKNDEVFLRILRKFATGKSIALEIGCGGGKITSHAVAWFDRIHATDVSRLMLKLSRNALRYNNKIQFHQIDGFTLKEFADNSIDVVYSHDVFVHFSSLQVYSYLPEIKRVIKPDGLLIISFYNFIHHFDLFKEMALAYHKDRRFPPHMRVHFVTEEMILTILEDLELRLVEINKENFIILVAGK